MEIVQWAQNVPVFCDNVPKLVVKNSTKHTEFFYIYLGIFICIIIIVNIIVFFSQQNGLKISR